MTESEIRHAVSDELVRDVLREGRSERRWRLIKRGMMVAAGVVFFALYLFGYAKQMGWKMIPNNEITAVIHIDGEISAGATASAEKVVPLLRKAFETKNVKAVVLSIDSPGGAPVEAERIYQSIKVFRKKHPKPDRTHAFYEKYGAKTIVLARFVPIVRTFAPFVAGVAHMHYARFLAYNVGGGLLWVGLFVFAGDLFGNIPIVRDNFTAVIMAIIVISVLPVVVEWYRARRGGGGA